MDIKVREKKSNPRINKVIALCDSTRDFTPDKDNLSKPNLISGNIKIEETKIEGIESRDNYQRRSRKDINFAKDRYKTNSYNRDCKPKNVFML
jgi:hypothetical protein